MTQRPSTPEPPSGPPREPPAQLRPFLDSALRFLGSMRLAIPILAVLLVVFAAATLVEVHAGRDYVDHAVYGSRWLEALLALLGLNVLAAMVNRWPWRRHHAGFLMTHIGILVVLAGAAVSRHAGWHGEMEIREGNSSNTVRLRPLVVEITEPPRTRLCTRPVFLTKASTDSTPAARFSCGPYEVSLDRFIPQASLCETFDPEGGPGDPPAVRIRLKIRNTSSNHWLVLRDPERDRQRLGPAEISFVDARDDAELRQVLDPQPPVESLPAGALRISLRSGKRQEIPIRDALHKSATLEGQDATITVTEYVENAAAAEDRVEGGGPDAHPAYRFLLRSRMPPERQESDWLFYSLPQRQRRAVLDGKGQIDVRLAATEAERDAYLAPVRFLEQNPRGQLLLKPAQGEWIALPVNGILGRRVRLGQTDLELEVRSFLPHATVAPGMKLVNRSPDLRNPAVEFIVREPQGEELHWVFADLPGLHRPRRSDGRPPRIEAARLLLPVSGREETELRLVHGPGERFGLTCLARGIETFGGDVQVGQPINLKPLNLEFTLEDYVPRAVHRLVLRTLDEPPPQGNSPAVRFRVDCSGIAREYVAFGSRAGQRWDTFPLPGPRDTGIEFIEYVVKPSEEMARNRLILVRGPDGTLHYSFQSRKGENQSGEVILNAEHELPWMPGASFTVDAQIEHARARQEAVPATRDEIDGETPSAMRVTIRRGRAIAAGWLVWSATHSSPATLSLGRDVTVRLGHPQIGLGFSIRLADFRDVRNPGGEGTASYESDVEIIDADATSTRRALIQMNRPLRYRGLSFFQASYRKPPGAPEVSIFTVSYDPGLPVVYAGSGILVVGILMSFILRRWPRKSPDGRAT